MPRAFFLCLLAALATPLHAQRSHVEVAGGIDLPNSDQPASTGLYGRIGLEIPTRRWRREFRFQVVAFRQTSPNSSSAAVGFEFSPILRLTPKPVSAFFTEGIGIYRMTHLEGQISTYGVSTSLLMGAGVRRSVRGHEIGLELRYVIFLGGNAGSHAFPFAVTFSF
jgi:hypothetical protein